MRGGGRAIWNLFEELGQSPATPPCAEAPGQPLALPARLRPERGKSVGEQTGGLHADKVSDVCSQAAAR